MKKIIIAMTNKLQADKLAIALSHSFDSVVVNSSAKLKELLRSSEEEYYTFVFEEDLNSESSSFADVIHKFSAEQKNHKMMSVRITDITSNLKDDISTVILKKPFGLKQLNDTIERVGQTKFPGSIAIA